MNGLFPEATVVRGHDWKWDNQDGQLGGGMATRKGYVWGKTIWLVSPKVGGGQLGKV